MRFSLATFVALCGLALAMSTAQASPVSSSSNSMLSRATPPSTSPVCANFKAACTTQCGTQQPSSKCTEFGKDKLPLLNCRCGKGWLADKTAEVLLRMALTCAAKPVVTLPVITYGPNLLLNPSFENGILDPWTSDRCQSFQGSRSKNDDKNKYIASCYYDFQSDSTLTQNIDNLVAAKTYTLTYWAKRAVTEFADGGSDANDFVPIQFSLGNSGTVDGLPLTTSWASNTHDFTGIAGSAQFVITAAAAATVQFDDFSIAEKITK